MLPADIYDKNVLSYITEYTKEHKVPPTIDQIIENVPDRTSKSTVHYRLQRMVEAGLLTQKNVKGYYYPTSLDYKMLSDGWISIYEQPTIGSAIWVTLDNQEVKFIDSFRQTFDRYRFYMGRNIIAWKYAKVPEPYRGD